MREDDAEAEDLASLTKCAYCGAPLSSRDAEWALTVNVTADCLFLGGSVMVDFEDAISDGPGRTAEAAYDWCNIDCFGQWIYQVADRTSAVSR